MLRQFTASSVSDLDDQILGHFNGGVTSGLNSLAITKRPYAPSRDEDEADLNSVGPPATPSKRLIDFPKASGSPGPSPSSRLIAELWAGLNLSAKSSSRRDDELFVLKDEERSLDEEHRGGQEDLLPQEEQEGEMPGDDGNPVARGQYDDTAYAHTDTQGGDEGVDTANAVFLISNTEDHFVEGDGTDDQQDDSCAEGNTIDDQQCDSCTEGDDQDDLQDGHYAVATEDHSSSATRTTVKQGDSSTEGDDKGDLLDGHYAVATVEHTSSVTRTTVKDDQTDPEGNGAEGDGLDDDHDDKERLNLVGLLRCHRNWWIGDDKDNDDDEGVDNEILNDNLEDDALGLRTTGAARNPRAVEGNESKGKEDGSSRIPVPQSNLGLATPSEGFIELPCPSTDSTPMPSVCTPITYQEQSAYMPESDLDESYDNDLVLRQGEETHGVEEHVGDSLSSNAETSTIADDLADNNHEDPEEMFDGEPGTPCHCPKHHGEVPKDLETNGAFRGRRNADGYRHAQKVASMSCWSCLWRRCPKGHLPGGDPECSNLLLHVQRQKKDCEGPMVECAWGDCHDVLKRDDDSLRRHVLDVHTSCRSGHCPFCWVVMERAKETLPRHLPTCDKAPAAVKEAPKETLPIALTDEELEERIRVSCGTSQMAGPSDGSPAATSGPVETRKRGRQVYDGDDSNDGGEDDEAEGDVGRRPTKRRQVATAKGRLLSRIKGL